MDEKEMMELGNENIEIMDNYSEDNMEIGERPSESGSGVLGKIAVASAVAVAGSIVALAIRHRGKREERRIEKLRKKGYTIYKSEVVENPEEETVTSDDVETEQVENQ